MNIFYVSEKTVYITLRINFVKFWSRRIMAYKFTMYITNQNTQHLSTKLEDCSAVGLGVVRGGTPGFLVLATRSALIFVLLLKCFVSDCPSVAEMNDAPLTNG